MKKKQSGVVFCSVLLPGRNRRNLQANLFRVLLRDEIAKRTASVENITFRCAIYFYRNINVLASVESHSGIFQFVETDTKLSLHHKIKHLHTYGVFSDSDILLSIETSHHYSEFHPF